jgi:hypothetical protein
MDWLRFALIAFATFTAWEWLLVVLPFSLPAGLQPLAVVGLAYEAQRCPHRGWRRVGCRSGGTAASPGARGHGGPAAAASPTASVDRPEGS